MGPWAPQQPYLTGMFSEAQRLYDQGPQQFYPGQTYVNPSAYSMAGIHQLANLGNVQNDPLYQLGSLFIGNSLGGMGGLTDFLGNQMNSGTQIGPYSPQQAPALPFSGDPGMFDSSIGSVGQQSGAMMGGLGGTSGIQPVNTPTPHATTVPMGSPLDGLYSSGGAGRATSPFQPQQPTMDVQNERQRILAAMLGGGPR